MRKAQQRLWMVLGAGLVLSLAASLTLLAIRDSVVFFYSPTMVAENPPLAGQRVRVGGLVVQGSVDRPDTGGAVFSVTDGRAQILIAYEGTLPDLFREGQGIVAEGFFEDSRAFMAETVLAKHDETYMPPEVADALKASGVWREADQTGDGF